MNTCATCRFFAPDPHPHYAHGECHRYPPANRSLHQGFGDFPMVQATWVCGEFAEDAKGGAK